MGAGIDTERTDGIGSADRLAVVGFVALKLVTHLALAPRYGIHRDEMYFLDCGRHLAFGYVDHAPFVPWVARAMNELAPGNLVVLRAPSAIAGAVTVYLAMRLARELGGGTFARVIAGACVLVGPAFLRMSSMLNIVAFEPVFWSLGALLLVRILRGDAKTPWLALGAVAGVGLMNKHTMLVWGFGLALGFLATPARRLLRTMWPWLGVAIAGLIVAPNVAWQMTHGWPTVEFIRNMSASTLEEIPRALFLLGQLLYASPLTLPVWVAGLFWLYRDSGGALRPLAVQFIAMVAVFLVTSAKPYYLAAAYPVLFAAGGVAIERVARRSRRGAAHRAALLFGVLALPLALSSLPIVSLPRLDAVFGRVLGFVVPPMALTHDLHDQYGWREQAEVVARVWADRDSRARQPSAIVARNYGEASAINHFGVPLGLPRAVSGHMSHHSWLGDAGLARSVLFVGFPSQEVAALCERPRERARIDHELAVPSERDIAVAECADLGKPLEALWPSLRRYRHGL